MTERFLIARNPDQNSTLPYLVRLPIEGGVVLKARDTWPRAARVFCIQDGTAWDDSAGVVDRADVVVCRRRGAAVDLVLARPSNARAQFVFTTARGRPAIWWQTQKTVQSANPGARIPRGRSAGTFTVAVDTREKYGWKFAGRDVTLTRRPLDAGDYAAMDGEAVVALVERKTLENLATSLSDGSLAFQMQRLSGHPAAVVVEGTYPELFRQQPGRQSWLADLLGRLAVRYPEVPIVFAGARKFAEEWAYRFLGAALSDRRSDAGASGETSQIRAQSEIGQPRT
jgi:hypothetical protein